MAATDVTAPTSSAPPPPRRPLRSRVSSGHVLTLAAALVAAVLNFAVIRGSDDAVPIVVARVDIPAGATLQPSHLETVPGGLGGVALASLVPAGDIATLHGQVTTVAVPAGAPLRRGDVAAPSASEAGARRIAIPVDRDRAVGGAIEVGDRIDVIRIVDGEASYLVSGAQVLAVADETTPGLGPLGGFHVTIAVDPGTALCLASAIDAGRLTLVLSTGQDPVATTPCTSASESAEEVAP